VIFEIFYFLLHLDTVYVKFEGQGHGSKFKVTEDKRLATVGQWTDLAAGVATVAEKQTCIETVNK